jgi:hypothetical protein
LFGVEGDFDWATFDHPMLPFPTLGSVSQHWIVCAHRLVTDFEYSAKAAANRHDPLLTRCRQPVRGDEWR